MNFLALRNDLQALYEIRQFAEAIDSFFYQILPVTHAVFNENRSLAIELG